MKNFNVSRFTGIFTFFCLFLLSQNLSAQATLSIQGIIRKSNGAAVDDGKYDLTFKLYNTTSGGTALHTETQNISVVGGIYSAELGNGTPLTAAFDQTYYLGVSVDGGAELVPRARLTSSPYALSLLGTTNLFPGGGTVGVGTTTPSAGYQMHIQSAAAAGKLLVEGSTAAQVDFKKGSTAASLGFANTGNTEFVLNPGANNTTLQYNGSTKLTVNNDGVNVAGTLNATTITGGFSPATMAVTTRMAVGQANVDASYAMKVNGQMNIAGGGLRISGTIPPYQTCSGCQAYFNNGAGIWGGVNEFYQTGLRVEGKNVDAQGYITQSDRRIKTNFLLSSPSSDLAMLNQLRVTDYQYIDKMVRGAKTVKGFVAQEVKAVWPDAVELNRDFIPSIYATPIAASSAAGQLRVEMDKAHDLKKGDRVRIFTNEGDQQEVNVEETPTDRVFVVKNWTGSAEKLFVFGKEVDDFHAVDFNRLTALNISATQELARQVEDLKKENAALKNENGTLKSEMKASAEKFDARLRALENRISN